MVTIAKFKKILISGFEESELAPEYWERINAICEQKLWLPKDSPEIRIQLKDTDCLLVKFNPVPRGWIEAAPNLKYIGVLATGYGKVATDYAKEKGIIVTNIPGYSTESVAEFVFGLILEHVRELERAKRQARDSNYDESGFTATEIKGKVFGVIGAGRIGSRVAEIALGFEADVRYWDRNRKKNLESKGIKYEDTDKLVRESDFLSLHLALTDETKNFINSERLQALKSGAVVVNTAPMELVDTDALDKRLAKGDIAFILDHSDEMTKESLEKLSKHENCIIYPPIGYISEEGKINKQEIFISNMESFLKEELVNVVN